MSKSTNKPAGAPESDTGKAKVVTLLGTVESDKRDKTRKVVVPYQSRHAKYGKYMRRKTVIHAHDEGNTSHAGDLVEVGPCRPMSKTKTWKVLRVVQAKAKD